MHARLRRWIGMLITVLLVAAPMALLAAGWSEVTDGRLLEADKDANNWLTYYRTYNGWRYSPLAQINTQTVKRLTPKWLLSLGEAGNQQITPLVNGDIMIVTSPSGLEINRVYAVDVASGRVLWKHEHKLPEELPSLARLIPMNRGAALYKDKVYFGTLDAHLIALKAATGEVAWKTKVADALDGYFFTMGGWPRPRPTWSSASSPGCQRGSG